MVQPTSARPSDAVAVAADTPPDTAAVAMSDQGATAMAVVIAGVPRMQGRGTRRTVVVATAKAGRINTVQAVTRTRNMRGRAAMATSKAGRLNTRIIPHTAAMAAPGGDRTLNVTVAAVTAAAVTVGPGSLRADSLPVAVAAASAIVQVVDALAGDANRSCGDGAAAIRCRRNLRRQRPTATPAQDRAVSSFGTFGVSSSA